jgi:Meiotically up-regulated gene 113
MARCGLDPGFVYAITDGAFIKIGVSSSPRRRLELLQIGHSSRLTILTALWHQEPARLEQLIHNALRSERVRGEWFRRSELTEEIVRILRDRTRKRLKAWLAEVSPPMLSVTYCPRGPRPGAT